MDNPRNSHSNDQSTLKMGDRGNQMKRNSENIARSRNTEPITKIHSEEYYNSEISLKQAQTYGRSVQVLPNFRNTDKIAHSETRDVQENSGNVKDNHILAVNANKEIILDKKLTCNVPIRVVGKYEITVTGSSLNVKIPLMKSENGAGGVSAQTLQNIKEETDMGQKREEEEESENKAGRRGKKLKKEYKHADDKNVTSFMTFYKKLDKEHESKEKNKSERSQKSCEGQSSGAYRGSPYQGYSCCQYPSNYYDYCLCCQNEDPCSMPQDFNNGYYGQCFPPPFTNTSNNYKPVETPNRDYCCYSQHVCYCDATMHENKMDRPDEK